MKIDLENSRNFKNNPFKVPEGYFEQFSENLMAQIPENRDTIRIAAAEPQKKGMIRYLRPVIGIAAASVAIFFSIGIYNYSTNIDKQAAEQFTAQQSSNEIIDDFCDYSRIEHSEIYDYVTESNNE